MSVRIQHADFDLSTEVAQLRANQPAVGAVVSFIGTVRDMNDGSSVASMALEHYPGMTEKALEQILEQARARWDLIDALVIHRVGPLQPQEQIVLVAVSAAHRGEAFAAAEFLMDFLKTRAPFWKQVESAKSKTWVEATAGDDAAAARWEKPRG